MNYEAILAAEGLAPLDREGVISNRGAGKPKDINTVLEREQGAALVEEAASIVRARMGTPEDRAVLRVIARGDGIKGAARALGIPYTRARDTYHRVVADWRSRQRKPLRLTPGRFMRTEPAFLLKLLEAL